MKPSFNQKPLQGFCSSIAFWFTSVPPQRALNLYIIQTTEFTNGVNYELLIWGRRGVSGFLREILSNHPIVILIHEFA